MLPEKSVLNQNIRRLCLITGFIFFMLFAYKATHEVSNPKIAAGSQRTSTVAMVEAQADPVVRTGLGSALYAVDVINTETPQNPSRTETLPTVKIEPAESLSRSKKQQPKEDKMPVKLATTQVKNQKN